MRASTKRAIVCLAFGMVGYALGFYDGTPPYGQIALGPVLLLLFLSPILLAKLAAFLWWWLKRTRSTPGSGDAPFPPVPRAPTGGPPVLSAAAPLR